MQINIIFCLYLFLRIEGLKNVTHDDVINRLKDTIYSVDIFKNYYGTCSANVLLFLRTIDLRIFEELSINVIQTKKGLTNNVMEIYLNQDIVKESKWFQFSGTHGLNRDELINRFVLLIKNKLIEMKFIYKIPKNQEILTVLNYPSKNREVYHSVIVWLTNKDEIIIIDPQQYYLNKRVELYTSEGYTNKYMDDDNMLIQSPIQTYLREHVDIISNYKDTYLLISFHYEISNKIGKIISLSSSGNILKDVINRIKNEEEKRKLIRVEF
jgi:hypothetical protein